MDILLRLGLLITGIELVVLVAWLATLAAGLLFVGIAIEEVVRFRGVTGGFPSARQLLLILLGVAVETAGWALPIALRTPPALTFVILTVALDIEHAIIRYATAGIFNLSEVLNFSLIEAAGGTIWLTNPSAGTIAILAVTSQTEHVQGLRQAFRDLVRN